ncbi:hypothetical protein DYB32_004109 [Aphanomyces invadans]|nr:hypothetical protein DYB32_004109 [Aphanomyces invadans]
MNCPVETSLPPTARFDDEHMKNDTSAQLLLLQDKSNQSHQGRCDPTVHDHLDAADAPTSKATQRRLKNRLACRANRKRKKAIRETLKMQVKQLSRSNSWLHQEINALLGFSLVTSSIATTSPPRSSPRAASHHPHPTYDPLAESTHMQDNQLNVQHVVASDYRTDAAAMVDAPAPSSSSWQRKDSAAIPIHPSVSQQRAACLQETAASYFRWFVGLSDAPPTDSTSAPFYSRDNCQVVGERATFCDAFHVGPHVSLESIWKTKAYLFDDLHTIQDVHVAAVDPSTNVVTITIVEEGILRDVWALRALFNPTFVVTLQLHFANSTPKVQLSWELVCHCVASNNAMGGRPTARRIDVALIKCDRL